MTKQEILDYNKRCAKFLTISEEIENELVAYPKQQYSPLCSYANAAYIADKEDNPDNTVWNYCKFHSDWNWIIEVVEAIEKLDNSKFYVSILESECSIIDKEAAYNEQNPFMIEPIAKCFEANSKKEAVIKAINQFLIWYNKNNKP